MNFSWEGYMKTEKHYNLFNFLPFVLCNLSVHCRSDESRTYEDGSVSYAGYISNSEAPNPNTFFRELQKHNELISVLKECSY